MDTEQKDRNRQVLARHLEAGGYRKTAERFAVWDAVCHTKGLFTAPEIGEWLARNQFHVSTATLYNTLSLLLQWRLIGQHQLQGRTVYESFHKSKNHLHQICSVCGRVTEFEAPHLVEAIGALSLKRFKADAFSLYVYGLCSQCRKKSKTD